MALSDHRDAVVALVRDDADAISGDERDDAIARAVARYSVHRPRRVTEDVVVGVGSVVPIAAGAYDPDVHQLLSVEYPVGELPPVYLEPGGVITRQTPVDAELAPLGGSIVELVALRGSIPVGATARITRTASHDVSATADTVPARDREAVAAWAAALLLDELAARGAGMTDSTIAADAVDYGGAADRYRRLARAHRDRYYELLGLDRAAESRPHAAGTHVSLGRRRLSTGGPPLTHYWPREAAR